MKMIVTSPSSSYAQLIMSRTAALEDLVDFAKKHSYIEDTPATLEELISKVNNVCMNLEEFALICFSYLFAMYFFIFL